MVLISIALLVIISFLIIVPYVFMLYNTKRKVHIIQTNGDNDRIIKKYSQAPGPFPWPIIGNLAILRHFKVPFEAFSELSNQFGDIYSLTLGSSRCLIVNNLDLIREVLIQNGKFFGGRPNFQRYHTLFGGDRGNSLALCDWSPLQQKRRNLARRHFSPVESSYNFAKMNDIGQIEIEDFMDKLAQLIGTGKLLDIKKYLQQSAANMFIHYMCSIRFDYDDEEFQKIVEYFDEIFWEINQGYVYDFLPNLSIFYSNHNKRIARWSASIRTFILNRIITHREEMLDFDETEKDFTHALLKSLYNDESVTRDTVLFMLEDFIGGHSSVGNLVLRALGYIVKNPHVGQQIRQEGDIIVGCADKTISIENMKQMPYTTATLFEVLRYSSSPIVPHVATEDAVISGYGVTKGTIIFINNYKLNTDERYWQEPNVFRPERFFKLNPIKTSIKNKLNDKFKRRSSEGSDSGVEVDKTKNLENVIEQPQLNKNIPHFLPFSIGRRTCIGKNILLAYSFLILSNIIHKYDVTANDHTKIEIIPASIALPLHSYSLTFTPRSKHL